MTTRYTSLEIKCLQLRNPFFLLRGCDARDSFLVYPLDLLSKLPVCFLGIVGRAAGRVTMDSDRV